MYFVEREKIEETLVFLDRQILLFKEQKVWECPLEKAALERLAHTMLEAILDVGNALIDGFIMRDPGSYEDIVDILIDEKVLTTHIGNDLKRLLQSRKILVQSYVNINHIELTVSFQQHLDSLLTFSTSVRNYLTNELGPVTAFRK